MTTITDLLQMRDRLPNPATYPQNYVALAEENPLFSSPFNETHERSLRKIQHFRKAQDRQGKFYWETSDPVAMLTPTDRYDAPLLIAVDQNMARIAADCIERYCRYFRQNPDDPHIGPIIWLLKGKTLNDYNAHVAAIKEKKKSETEFTDLLKALLSEEYGHTKEAAERIVSEHTNLVINGIMHGNMALRGVAMALDDLERKRPQS